MKTKTTKCSDEIERAESSVREFSHIKLLFFLEKKL